MSIYDLVRLVDSDIDIVIIFRNKNKVIRSHVGALLNNKEVNSLQIINITPLHDYMMMIVV